MTISRTFQHQRSKLFGENEPSVESIFGSYLLLSLDLPLFQASDGETRQRGHAANTVLNSVAGTTFAPFPVTGRQREEQRDKRSDGRVLNWTPQASLQRPARMHGNLCSCGALGESHGFKTLNGKARRAFEQEVSSEDTEVI